MKSVVSVWRATEYFIFKICVSHLCHKISNKKVCFFCPVLYVLCGEMSSNGSKTIINVSLVLSNKEISVSTFKKTLDLKFRNIEINHKNYELI